MSTPGPIAPSDHDINAHRDTATPIDPPLKRAKLSPIDQSNSNRKPRREFTASEKLSILSELESPNPPPIKQILSKYGLSKSSLHRWRAPLTRDRLVEMVQNSATEPSLLYKGDKKRDLSDPLLPLKQSLQQFIQYNASLPHQQQYAIRSGFLQVKSRELRNQLLSNHDTDPDTFPLTTAEYRALRSFKGSKSWSCQTASQLGLLQTGWTEASEANSKRYLDAILEDAEDQDHDQLFIMEKKRPPKARVEFTAADKLRILEEVHGTNLVRRKEGAAVWSVEEICERYGTSKSSLHRWKQQLRGGHLQKAVGGGREIKRIFKDKLRIVKGALEEFYNSRMGVGEGVNYAMLQRRALEVRDELVREYEEVNPGERGKVLGNGHDGAVLSTISDGDGVVDIDNGEDVCSMKECKCESERRLEKNNNDLPPMAAPESATAPGLSHDEYQAFDTVEDADNVYSIPIEEQGLETKNDDPPLMPYDYQALESTAMLQSTPIDECTIENNNNSINIENQLTSTTQPAGEYLSIHIKESTLNTNTNTSNDGNPPPATTLTQDEYQALKNFKASVSWLREVARRYDWVMETDDGKSRNWRSEGRRVLYDNYYMEGSAMEAETVDPQEEGASCEEPDSTLEAAAGDSTRNEAM